MNVGLINKINNENLNKELLNDIKEDLIEVIPFIEKQINLLYIYTYSLITDNQELFQAVKKQLNKVYDQIIDYHNYDLMYIYAKNENIDLSKFKISSDNRDNEYNIYFEKDSENELYFDLNILNLSYLDYVEYFQYKGTTSTSMKSNYENNEKISRLVKINEESFENIISNPVKSQIFFNSNSLKVILDEDTFKIESEKYLPEHKIDPFKNKLTKYENFIFFEQSLERIFYKNEFFLFYVLSNINHLNELNNYPNITSFIFDTYANEVEAYETQKKEYQLYKQYNLDINTKNVKFKNIILIDKLINDFFINKYISYIKGKGNSEQKQMGFLSLRYLIEDELNLTDFFDKEFLSGYYFELKYGSSYGNQDDYSKIKYNSYFKKLYTTYVLEQKDIEGIKDLYDYVDMDVFLKFVSNNVEFFQDYKEIFFKSIYTLDIFSPEEYNKLLLKNILKNDDRSYGLDMVNLSKDKDAFYEMLSPIKKGILYYVDKNVNLINHFKENKELLLNNKVFLELLIEGENESFIKSYIDTMKNTSVIFEINEMAEKYNLDISELKDTYSTLLIKDVAEVF